MNLNLTNKEILQYICLATILGYIWYVSKISLRYIFPFMIFCIIVFYYEKTKHENSTNNQNLINQIKKDLFDENYSYLIDEEIILYINDIRIMKNFNGPIFNVLLSEMNSFYQYRTLPYLLRVVETFESLYFVLPLELNEFYITNDKRLKKILYNNLVERKEKTVEMQSYLPKDYIQNNFN